MMLCGVANCLLSSSNSTSIVSGGISTRIGAGGGIISGSTGGGGNLVSGSSSTPMTMSGSNSAMMLSVAENHRLGGLNLTSVGSGGTSTSIGAGVGMTTSYHSGASLLNNQGGLSGFVSQDSNGPSKDPALGAPDGVSINNDVMITAVKVSVIKK
jgi:hypothetical protein